MRYPDKFHIQSTKESKLGSDRVYTDDLTREPFVFEGRIRKISPIVQPKLQGDLSKATNTINCPVLSYPVQMGETVYSYSDEKSYEVLFIEPGQRALKLWVAYS